MKEMSMIYAANTIAINIGSFLVMVFTSPMAIAVKSWQNLYGIIAVCVGISALLWTFLGKNNKSKKNTAVAPEKQKKTESRIVLAFKHREIILLTVIMTTCMAVFITFVTYLPIYLSGAYGISPESAAVTASIIALAAMGGVILGGIATTAIGLRKPFIAPAIIIVLVGAVGSLYIYPGFLLYIMAGCIGFGYNMFIPVLQTIPAEIKNSTPRLVSSAFAIIFGISSIVSFFPPFFVGPVTNYFGLRTALLMISMLLLPGIIAGIILPETGQKRKNDVGSHEWYV
jgi:cyanate permease